LADLFLDTTRYNAHTTASDALWAGLPLITCLGDSFPGRVAASLLHAIGLSDLITQSLADYEALAFRIATSPPLLSDIRSRLALNKTTHPLFDTKLFTENMESVLLEMWTRYRQGLPPDHLIKSPGH
jgi:predicted O-linked N-acetylglucosamine transferase (SPINDLY family)